MGPFVVSKWACFFPSFDTELSFIFIHILSVIRFHLFPRPVSKLSFFSSLISIIKIKADTKYYFVSLFITENSSYVALKCLSSSCTVTSKLGLFLLFLFSLTNILQIFFADILLFLYMSFFDHYSCHKKFLVSIFTYSYSVTVH